MTVTSYVDKKLVEYLKPGMSVCLYFKHGLGDTFMFYPVFLQLRKLYPDVDFYLHTQFGQEEFFGKVDNREEAYDIFFVLAFPCNERRCPTTHTKVSLCCEAEIGIQYDPAWEFSWKIPKVQSPLVAVHFHSTARPLNVGCPEAIAKSVWNGIKKAGYIPIEVHFSHQPNQPHKNTKYDFVTNTVRDCKCTVDNLVGLLQSCAGFVGVSSGPFCVATQLYPDKVLHLKNSNAASCYYKTKTIQSLDVTQPFNDKVFRKWIQTLTI